MNTTETLPTLASRTQAVLRCSNWHDVSQEPRDNKGQWSRFRPAEMFHFPKPLTGPSGAKLVAYQWQYKPEEYVDKTGEDRIRRVSDWERAEDSSATGRGLVHQFHVEMPDKRVQLVSSETVPQLLGFEQYHLSPGAAKSVMTVTKTLAKLKMALAIVQEKQAHNDAIWKQVEQLRFPVEDVRSRKAWSDPTSKAQRFYMENSEGNFQVQHEEGPATPYTIHQLETNWRGASAMKLGMVHIRESQYDLKNRIERQERKINAMIQQAQKSDGATNQPTGETHVDHPHATLAARITNLLRATDATPSPAAAHDAARQVAANRYAQAVSDFISHAKAEAMAKRKKKREEMAALFLLLMADAGTDAYNAIYPKLAPLSTPPGQPTPAHRLTPPIRGEADEFAAGRQTYLAHFPQAVLDKLDAVVQQGAHDAADPGEIRRELNKRAQEIRDGEGQTVVDTEAQSCYGAAQIKIMKRAGLTHKIWQTMEDDRVRDSHENCQLQGPIPLDAKFANGLRYPGEAGAPPSEVCNCRCWLRGETR